MKQVCLDCHSKNIGMELSRGDRVRLTARGIRALTPEFLPADARGVVTGWESGSIRVRLAAKKYGESFHPSFWTEDRQ